MDYAAYVNPNIGTVGHLLATTQQNVQSPHGCAVITPSYTPGMKDIYNADKIYGFRMGGGWSGAAIIPSVSAECPDFWSFGSRFDHDFEEVHPYEYSVLLEDSNIYEKHTSMKNAGVFSFEYPSADTAYAYIYVPDCKEFTVSAGRIGVKSDLIYTLLDFDPAAEVDSFEMPKPFIYTYGAVDPHTILKVFRVKFHKAKADVRFVLSTVSFDSCKSYLEQDLAGKGYAEIREECHAAWNNILSKVEVEGGDDNAKTVFYTGLYRVLSRMHNYSVHGEYIGFDGKVHKDEEHDYYCDDGIWDTYRGAHPLQLILEPDVHKDILASYIKTYEQSGWMARFPSLGGNHACMLGHHTVSLYADALAKGIDFDLEKAYEAVYKNATQRTMAPWMDGEAGSLTKCYYEKGFFPGLEEDEEEPYPEQLHSYEDRQSVAVTLEHAYDDWCVAQLAARLGKHDDAAYFMKRSQNYRNVYDPEIGFVRPRKENGEFVKEYDPKFCGGQGGRKYFAENNAYIYNYHIQHDLPGMVEMHGGKEAFAAKLNQLFIEQYDGWLKSKFLGQYPDATGLMGQFCMGNEPSFHVPYLFNACGQAYMTQRKIHEIIRLWFTNSPLGVCGDEDGGAMSAFLVFSAMGFYPVCPGSDQYNLGSPVFDKISIKLDNGKVFTVVAEGASGKAKYIQKAEMNGTELEEPAFSHGDLAAGGTLVLTMGERPNKELWSE